MKRLIAMLSAVLALSGCGYNDFQRLDEQSKAAWSEVLNQYQRRADLVPNIVATVKGEAAFEQDTLTKVVEARAKATSMQVTPETLNNPEAFQKFQQAQGELSGALSRLMVVAERYPTLQANQGFRDLRVTLEEAFRGVQKTISVPASTTCDVCKGTGAEGGAEPVTCPTCSGLGRVRAQQGFFTMERTCPSCNGAGQIVKNPCKSCHGQGRVERERQLSVNIPAGVETGTRIRLAGEGEAGMRGGPTGDLYIFIEVRDHAIFQRDGIHLFCRVPVPMTAAALGGEIEVPTIDGGMSRVKIPAGSQTGKQMRLRSKGMPALRGGGQGDMLIELAVETPVNLTARQKELLREFEKLSADNNPEGSSFFAKVKGFWDGMKS